MLIDHPNSLDLDKMECSSLPEDGGSSSMFPYNNTSDQADSVAAPTVTNTPICLPPPPKSEGSCLCGKNTIYRCSRCGNAFYCSRRCQKEDWSVSHHQACVQRDWLSKKIIALLEDEGLVNKQDVTKTAEPMLGRGGGESDGATTTNMVTSPTRSDSSTLPSTKTASPLLPPAPVKPSLSCSKAARSGFIFNIPSSTQGGLLGTYVNCSQSPSSCFNPPAAPPGSPVRDLRAMSTLPDDQGYSSDIESAGPTCGQAKRGKYQDSHYGSSGAALNINGIGSLAAALGMDTGPNKKKKHESDHVTASSSSSSSGLYHSPSSQQPLLPASSDNNSIARSGTPIHIPPSSSIYLDHDNSNKVRLTSIQDQPLNEMLGHEGNGGEGVQSSASSRKRQMTSEPFASSSSSSGGGPAVSSYQGLGLDMEMADTIPSNIAPPIHPSPTYTGPISSYSASLPAAHSAFYPQWTVSEEALASLMDMGFEEGQSRNALKLSINDVNRAIEYILSGAISSTYHHGFGTATTNSTYEYPSAPSLMSSTINDDMKTHAGDVEEELPALEPDDRVGPQHHKGGGDAGWTFCVPLKGSGGTNDSWIDVNVEAFPLQSPSEEDRETQDYGLKICFSYTQGQHRNTEVLDILSRDVMTATRVYWPSLGLLEKGNEEALIRKVIEHVCAETEYDLTHQVGSDPRIAFVLSTRGKEFRSKPSFTIKINK